MGCRELSTVATVARRLYDHPLTGPSGVVDQSFSRHSRPISPSCAKTARWSGGTATASGTTLMNLPACCGNGDRVNCEPTLCIALGKYHLFPDRCRCDTRS